jgi:hypothetical protein
VLRGAQPVLEFRWDWQEGRPCSVPGQDNDPATGSDHSNELREGQFRALDVAQDTRAPRRIERVERERQVTNVTDPTLHPSIRAARRKLLGCDAQHVRIAVEGSDEPSRADPIGQPAGNATRAAAGVQDGRARPEGEVRDEVLKLGAPRLGGVTE